MMAAMLVAMALIIAVGPAAAEPWQPERFPISYWYGPPPEANTLETWQTVADCGFTFAGPRGYPREEILRQLDFCEQVGIKALPHDGRISWEMTGAPDWKEQLAEVVADYGGHPALYGYYVKDEPNYMHFQALGEICRELERLDPDSLPYVNLFPTYANSNQLGTPTYEEHVREYLRIVQPRVLSYDHYALLRDGGQRPDYYENLEIIRREGLSTGTPQWQIVLSLAHLAYRDPTEGEMRWQVYTSLAYGMKGIMYFTYWPPASLAQEGRFGIVDGDGNPARLYPIVQQLNSEIAALGPTLLRLTSTGVYHTGEQIPAGTTRQGTEAIVRAPEDLPLIVGMFEDEEGNQFALVASRDYENPLEFELSLAAHIVGVHAISAEDGSENQLQIEDGRVAVALPPGGGLLMRLETQFDYPQPPRVLDEIDFQFDEDGDTEGWGGAHSLGEITVEGGVLSMTITGADPYIVRRYLRVPAAGISAIRARMRVGEGSTESGQLFWATADAPGFSDQRYLNFDVTADGQWHQYTIPVGDHGGWDSTIIALRFDPSTAADDAGTRVEVDWIVAE